MCDSRDWSTWLFNPFHYLAGEVTSHAGLSVGFYVAVLVGLLMVVWMVQLMYRGFAVIPGGSRMRRALAVVLRIGLVAGLGCGQPGGDAEQIGGGGSGRRSTGRDRTGAGGTCQLPL